MEVFPIHAQLQAPDYHIDWDIVKKMINKKYQNDYH